MSPPHVLIIGAGILGASLAWHLARAGARVTVVAQTSGGTATPNSFAWINASFGNDAAYFRLRFDSMGRWRRLEQEISGLGMSWGGSLSYDMTAEELERYAAEFSPRGYPVRLVDEAEARSPRTAPAAPAAPRGIRRGRGRGRAFDGRSRPSQSIGRRDRHCPACTVWTSPGGGFFP